MKIELGKRYRTRDGRDVRIYAVDGGGNKPIHGAVQQGEVWVQEKWSASGEWAPEDMARSLWDLIEVRPRIKREFWVNVYPNGVDDELWLTKATAEQQAMPRRIACVRVEIDVEEGHGLE